jgi:flagellar protein FlgJ
MTQLSSGTSLIAGTMASVDVPSPVQADSYHDLGSLRQLRSKAADQSPEAIRAVAKQLEGLFLNLMLKSMRQASDVLAADNPFSSREIKTFEEMRDQQLGLNLAAGGGIGLARVIERQLTQQESKRWKEPDGVADSASTEAEAPSTPELKIDWSRRVPAVHTKLETRSLPVHEAQAIRGVSETPPSEAAEMDGRLPLMAARSMANVKNEFKPSGPIDFIDQITVHAQRAADRLGISAEAILAQAALETGWGAHQIRNVDGSPTFNLFGIKADARWTGQSVDIKTTEYRNGIAAQEVAAFRSYDSLASAFDDYASFLASQPKYRQALDTGQNPLLWGERLQQAGYATDPDYGKKIASIVSRLMADANNTSP